MDAEGCIRKLNEAWQRGRFDELAECFDRDVVMLLPDGDQTLRGRDAMVASYREFLDVARLNAMSITGLTVFDYRATAVCHMHFDIDYSINGARERASGMEVYVVREGSAGPVVVWRTQRLFGETPSVTVERQP